MKRKYIYLIIIFLLLFILILTYILYRTNNFSYLIAIAYDQEHSDTEYTQTINLYTFRNDKCISHQTSIQGYNYSIAEIYNAILEAERCNAAIILNYSQEQQHLTYKLLELDINKTKSEIKNELSENSYIKQIIEF
jgi:hypothetical protein